MPSSCLLLLLLPQVHTRQNGLSALRASSIELRTGVSQVKVEPVKDTIIESNPKNY